MKNRRQKHSDLGGALSTSSRRGAARLVDIVVVVFGTGTVRVIAAEQIHNLLEAELERVLLHASLDGRLGEQTLLLLQLEDTLLHRLLDEGFENDDSGGCSEVETQAATLETAKQDARVLVVAQAVQASLALVVLHAAVIAREFEALLAEEGFHKVHH
ncbi:snf2 family domain-containing protein [Colletotrichum asianum]